MSLNPHNLVSCLYYCPRAPTFSLNANIFLPTIYVFLATYMFFNFILLPARQLRNALSKHELSNLSTCQDGSKSTEESSTTNRAGLAFLAMFESTQLYLFFPFYFFLCLIICYVWQRSCRLFRKKVHFWYPWVLP